MGRQFPLLVASQVSNTVPILAFVLFSDTQAFAAYIVILLAGQLLSPLVTARLETQVQIELQRSRQDYYALMALEGLAAVSLLGLVLFALAPSVWVGWGSAAIAVATAAQNLTRAQCVARERGLVPFEAANIARNLVSLGIAALVAPANVALVVIGAQAAFALVCVAASLRMAHPGGPWRSLVARTVRHRRVALRRARRVLTMSLPSSFISMATGRLPLLAVEAAVPAAAAAGFLSASRIALAPLNFILYAVRINAIVELNRLRSGRTSRFRALFWMMSLSAPILLSPMLVPQLFAPLLAPFDPSWLGALDMMPLIYPWAVAFLMTGWMDRVFDIRAQQAVILKTETFILGAGVLVSLVVASGVAGVWGSFVLVVALNVVHCAIWFVLFARREFAPATVAEISHDVA